MQKTGAGLHTANSCYWDTALDGEDGVQLNKQPEPETPEQFEVYFYTSNLSYKSRLMLFPLLQHARALN